MRKIESKGNLPTPLRSLVNMVLKYTENKLYVFLLTSGNTIDRLKETSLEYDLVRDVVEDKKTGKAFYVAFGKPMKIDYENNKVIESDDRVLYFVPVTNYQKEELIKKTSQVLEEEKRRLEQIRNLISQGYKVENVIISKIIEEAENAKPIS